MLRRQTVAQAHRQFERLIIVHCFEGSTHTHQYIMTDQRYLLLSDKLLGDLIIGLVGAFLGGLIINLVVPDATFGFWGSLLVALIGACILVAILHAIAGRRTTTARP